MRTWSIPTRTSRIAAAALLALLTGCAGQRAVLNKDERKTLITEQVHVVHIEPIGFLVEGSGSGIGIQPGVEDPVVGVTERLLAALEEHYRLPNVIRVAKPSGRLAPDSQYGSLKGMLFEVRTTFWGISSDRARYAAGARMLRLSDGVVLWNATCDEVTVDRDRGGALLDAELHEAAQICANQLARAIERTERQW